MAEMESQAAVAQEESSFGTSEFANLLKKEFRPKSDEARSAVEEAVKTLAQQALENTALVSDDALRSIEGIIAEIDKKLTEQINQVMHHEEFQKLEGSRGVGCTTSSTTPKPMRC